MSPVGAGTPIGGAIFLLRTQGCFGAKEYARRMLAEDPRRLARGVQYWREVSEILQGLNCRQTSSALIDHLITLRKGGVR